MFLSRKCVWNVVCKLGAILFRLQYINCGQLCRSHKTWHLLFNSTYVYDTAVIIHNSLHSPISICSSCKCHICAGLILGLHPANERHCYKVTPSLIGWAQTWRQSCMRIWIKQVTGYKIQLIIMQKYTSVGVFFYDWVWNIKRKKNDLTPFWSCPSVLTLWGQVTDAWIN